VTDCFDVADAFVPGDQGKGSGEGAIDVVEVAVADACRFHGDEDLSRPGLLQLKPVDLQGMPGTC